MSQRQNEPAVRVRPWSRRVSTLMNGPLATLVLVALTLYLTVGPMPFVYGPDTDDVVAGLVAFGAHLGDGAVEFQGIILGVLAALFIGRVIAPAPDVRNQTAVDLGSAAAGHFLAAIVIDAALFVIVGTAGQQREWGHIWFVSVLAIIAFGLAQAVDADVTFGSKRQRRRTRNDLITTSWAIHRRAAVLLTRGNTRFWARRVLAAVMIGTTLVAAATGTLVVVALVGSSSMPYLPGVAAVAVVLAAWTTIWVTFLAGAVSAANPPRALRGTAWAMTLLTTITPAVAAAFAPTGPSATPVKIGIIVTTLIPFLHLTGRVPLRRSLQACVLAVELRRYRRRRIVLLHDYWALRRRPGTRKAASKRTSWENRAVEALLRSGRKRTWKLPKPASLQHRRPDTGPGSREWLLNAGTPAMYQRRRRIRDFRS